MKNVVLILIASSISFLSFSQKEEWDDYFMPGIGYRVYAPKNQQKLGVYQGIVTEFVVYARAVNNPTKWTGPARVKTYGNLSILKSDSDSSSATNIFNINFGLNLSFESRTNRNWFIPYFGLEVGGLFQRNFSSFQLIPVAGVQLVSNRHLIWNLQAGYNYTVKDFEDYSGLQFASTLNILLWN